MHISFTLIGTIFLIVASGIVFTQRPDWGVYAVVAFLPFERIGTYSIGRHTIRLSQILAVGLILGCSWLLVRKRLSIKLGVPLFLLFGLILAAFLSCIPVGNSHIWFNFLTLVFSALVFTSFCSLANKISPSRLAKISILSATIVSVFGIYQYIGNLLGLPNSLTGLSSIYAKGSLIYPRLQSTAVEPQYFANYLLFPLFIGTAFLTFRKINRPWTFLLALLVLALLLTMSRGAFVASLFSLVIMTATVREWRKQLTFFLATYWGRILLVFASIILAGGIFVGLGSLSTTGSFVRGPKIFSQLVTSGIVTSSSFRERAGGSKTAFTILMQKPFLGVGLGRLNQGENFPSYRLGYDKIIVNNTFVQLAVEIGLIGLAVYLIFLLALVAQGLKIIGSNEAAVLGLGITAAIIAWGIQAIALSGFYLMSFWVYGGILLGVTKGLNENRH